jgi:hypothetical protein
MGGGKWEYVPERSDAKPIQRPVRPPVGSQEHYQDQVVLEPGHMPQPRSFWDRFSLLITDTFANDPDMPVAGVKAPPRRTWWEWVWAPMFVMLPETYSDPWLKPNRCPERFLYNPWKHPSWRENSPKIPPPVDGKFADYMHYVAFKHYMWRERSVYIGHAHLMNYAIDRCLFKENNTARKNCMHIIWKYFAMTRCEEYNQSMLYLAFTGNTPIRETPYPVDFVQTKQKIYDDWLHRTRMKQPGDDF